MVYVLSYQPKPNSYPDAQLIGGDTDRMELEDTTPDGGVALTTSQYFSGRRLRTENAPAQVQWLSSRKLQDFEGTRMYNVSARLRDLMEQLEPGVHQFIPVEFVTKDGSPLETRWYWQVCNRLDSVHREKTNYTLSEGGFLWRAPKDAKPLLVFDLSKIGTRKFWSDKHLGKGPYVTDDVRDAFERAGVTGARYHYYDQA